MNLLSNGHIIDPNIGPGSNVFLVFIYFCLLLLLPDFIRCEFEVDLCEYQTRTSDELSRFLWQRKNAEQLIAENIPGPTGLEHLDFLNFL